MSEKNKSFPLLTKAPIVEALVDFRVRSQPSPISLETIEGLHEKIKDKYPSKSENKIYHTNLAFNESGTSEQTISGVIAGYRFESHDKKFVLQLSPDGFTLSKLPPYSKWEDLINEAKWCWNVFVEHIQSDIFITRTATRFINRIEIPIIDKIDFDDFLTTCPPIPSSLPQITGEFLSRNVIACPDEGAGLVLTQSFQSQHIQESHIPVIIDIDVFNQDDYSGSGNHQWELLESLRNLKNEAFFGSITDKALTLFE